MLSRKKASITIVAKKIQHLGFTIFLVYVVTISVFPAVTSLILSVNLPAETKEDGLVAAFRTPALFVPLGFVVYATGDWIGRTLPQFGGLRVRDWKVLFLCAVARLAFIVSSFFWREEGLLMSF